jgi:hypothetical protein
MPRSAVLVALILAATLPDRAIAQEVPPSFNLRISAPTYFTNGEVRRASPAGRPDGWRLGETTTWVVTSGATLCDLRPPVRTSSARQLATDQARYLRLGDRHVSFPDPPYARLRLAARALLEASQDAASGWRLDVVPVRVDRGALVLSVSWTRIGGNRARFAREASSSATLTLEPGANVLLDRLSADSVSGCDAIGLGLEVGLEAGGAAPLVETELWLVHRHPDGAETSEKQVVRARLGEAAPYAFPGVLFGRDVLGRIRAVEHNDTLEMIVSIERDRGAAPAGAAFNYDHAQVRYRISPTRSDEVTSFKVLRYDVESNQRDGGVHEFSLRARSQLIR